MLTVSKLFRAEDLKQPANTGIGNIFCQCPILLDVLSKLGVRLQNILGIHPVFQAQSWVDSYPLHSLPLPSCSAKSREGGIIMAAIIAKRFFMRHVLLFPI